MDRKRLIIIVVLLAVLVFAARAGYNAYQQWKLGQIMDGPGMDPAQTLMDAFGISEEEALAILNGEVELSEGPEDAMEIISQDPDPGIAADPAEETIAWNYEEFPEDYTFRNQKLLNQHYEKHGMDMGFASAEEYEEAANALIHHPDVLHKIEAEDGDDVFYLVPTNEFAVLSTDGYIRTYFCPDGGKAYFDRQ